MLGFACIGFYLIYIAYRYNLLFVHNATIDTKGLVYPKALQQTMVGIYLAEVCLIGLFGIKGAGGPVVLEVLLLIGTVLFHSMLNSSLAPMMMFLPKSLAAEEEALLALEGNTTVNASFAEKGEHQARSETDGTVLHPDKETALDPKKKPSMLSGFLRPDLFSDYHTLRRLVPKDFSHIQYAPEVERDAYFDPAIASQIPLLWIPRDPLGVSRQEVVHSSKVIPMTDEGAVLSSKGKIEMDQTTLPPIHEHNKYF